VIAYMFYINDLPPGDAELGTHEAELRTIVIRSAAPSTSSPEVHD